jgi:hypothetical protein
VDVDGGLVAGLAHVIHTHMVARKVGSIMNGVATQGVA